MALLVTEPSAITLVRASFYTIPLIDSFPVFLSEYLPVKVGFALNATLLSY